MPACASPGEGRACATAFRSVAQLLLRVTAEMPVKPRGPAPPCTRSRGVWGISCRQSALCCARRCAVYRGGAWLDTVTRGPCTGLARSRWPPCPWPTTSPPVLLQKLVAAGKMGTPRLPRSSLPGTLLGGPLGVWAVQGSREEETPPALGEGRVSRDCLVAQEGANVSTWTRETGSEAACLGDTRVPASPSCSQPGG